MTQCTKQQVFFQDLGSREVSARFDGFNVTSDAGGLLLREVELQFQFIAQFAACFTDHRDPDLTEHSLLDLLKQRIFGLCLGYEDLNDHEQLRVDPLLAVLVGKNDPEGKDRARERDQGKPLAGKSTLNRLELTPTGADADDRYKKIVCHLARAQASLVEFFIQQQTEPPKRIVLDVDATDDPTHGRQLGSFFHGYYRNHCYLPLYIFCGDAPLLALLRPSNIGVSVGLLKQLSRIVGRLREVWPDVPILLRADSGFCCDPTMSWCEQNKVDYLFGLAKNKRLEAELAEKMAEAKQLFVDSGEASRVFADFDYRTRDSWSRARRVVGKAEYLEKGENPRFVVSSLSRDAYPAQELYEQEYCARGECENRIKEQQLMLFADRTSCATMRANQIRLLLSTVAYVIMSALRTHGLKNTELETAQCNTIRLKLLKIGAVIQVSVRRVFLSLSESYAFRTTFLQVIENLRKLVVDPMSPPHGEVHLVDSG